MTLVRISVAFVLFAALAILSIAAKRLNAITLGLVILAADALLLLVAELALRRSSRARRVRLGIVALLGSATLAIAALEFGLRSWGRYANYYEQNGSHDYRSLYEQDTGSRYRVHVPNTDVSWTENEFTHTRRSNSLGLSETEVAASKPVGEFRIVAIGDSFTEGVGTGYDTTWVKVVEKTLSARLAPRTVTTINAGISGSDVCAESTLLREKLLPYAPDLVIVDINNSDLMDVILRGGSERFQGSAVAAPRKGPSWEWLYGISYIVRHVAHDLFRLNWLLLSDAEMQAEERVAIDRIQACVDDIAALSQQKAFGLLVVFNPLEYEVNAERYSSIFQDLVARNVQAHGARTLDLLDDYRARKLITKDNSGEYFWRADLHHNTKGYEVMGTSIAAKLIASGLVPTR